MREFESTYKTVSELFTSLQSSNIDGVYLIGGISAAIQSGVPLYRQNGDIDLMVDIKHLDSLVNILDELGYDVVDRRGALTRNTVDADGEFHAMDHELNADLRSNDRSKLGIGIFTYSRKDGVVITHSYSYHQEEGRYIGRRTEMPEELFDLMYDPDTISFDGNEVRCQSKAYTYLSKLKDTRSKSKQDVDVISAHLDDEDRAKIERIRILQKRKVEYIEYFENGEIVREEKVPSADEKVERFVKQLLGTNIYTMTPTEVKNTILTNPKVIELSQRSSDIAEILSIYSRCPITRNVVNQLKTLTHSYYFDDDFDADKFISDQREYLEV